MLLQAAPGLPAEEEKPWGIEAGVKEDGGLSRADLDAVKEPREAPGVHG